MARPHLRRSILVILTAAPAVVWALSVAGLELHLAIGRLSVVAALGALSAAIGPRWLAALRSSDQDRRRAAWALTVLVAVSFVLRFGGLAFELTTHFHNDEGIFLETAQQINAGDALPGYFHYPHLLYYMSAFVLWLQGLFPGVAGWFAGTVYGVQENEVSYLLLRMLAATFGALTTVPVFLAARRAAGSAAALVAGALIAVSPIYNEVAHLAISDVPSGFFAALTVLFAARLLDGERLSDYLLAGSAAALAAASKYPAGVSALAIVGIWVYWRIRRRDLNALLIWSGLISIATLLAVMPALWLRSEAVVVGPGAPDILFGFRQYARHGWIGVVEGSNTGYYLRGLAENFGLPALLAGAAGLFLLPARERRRTLALLPYPVLFQLLLLSMSMVVKRNMQPLLPAVAVVLGCGLSAWPALVRRKNPIAARWAAPLLVGLFLVLPAVRSLAWDVSRMRAGTRELALEWIDANIPQGAGFIKEAYTPHLHPRRYAAQQSRYAARLEIDQILDPRWDYLFLARNAHLRFLSSERRFKEHHDVFARRYERLFELELVQRFQPGPLRSGPDLLIYRLEPDRVEYATERRFEIDDATWFSDPALQPRKPGQPVRFTRDGQSALFKQHFEPGTYGVRINAQPEGVRSWLYLVTRDNEEVAELELELGTTVTLPRRGKYFFRIFLSPGGVLREVQVTPSTPPGA